MRLAPRKQMTYLIWTTVIVPVKKKRKVSVSLVQEEFHMILLIVLKMS